ncbi:MAG: T9SS type A sorting domain-containing protein, partial [Bacteroidetes bacterium]|nr:T9SS type A sorting domain-containing protein [Bacteroidota bacterium]
PYTYLWDDPGSQTDSIADSLSVGTYIITVTDSGGCIGFGSVTITQPPQLISNITGSNIACNGDSTGSSTVTPVGGTPPYAYLWDPQAGGQTDSTATGLTAGIYTVTVTDSNACVALTAVTITQLTALSLAITDTNDATCGLPNGSAIVTPQGGMPPYSYLWNTFIPQTDSTAIFLAPGPYTVIVTDSNGCQGTLSVIVTEPPLGITEFGLNITFEIYPNPSAGIFTFEIQNLQTEDINIDIYNVLGEKVFTRSIPDVKNITQKIDLGSLPGGIYFVKLFTAGEVINSRIAVVK